MYQYLVVIVLLVFGQHIPLQLEPAFCHFHYKSKYPLLRGYCTFAHFNGWPSSYLKEIKILTLVVVIAIMTVAKPYFLVGLGV